MRQFAARNRYHFNSAEAGVQELQRGCVDIGFNLATYSDQICLIDLRKTDFPYSFRHQNRPLRACIDKGVRRGKSELVRRS